MNKGLITFGVTFVLVVGAFALASEAQAYSYYGGGWYFPCGTMACDNMQGYYGYGYGSYGYGGYGGGYPTYGGYGGQYGGYGYVYPTSYLPQQQWGYSGGASSYAVSGIQNYNAYPYGGYGYGSYRPW